MHARVSEAAGACRPPVVLVHGLGVSSRYLVPTAELLAPDVRVYAPDLPGFGKSDDPPRALDVPELTDALAAWMGAFHIKGAVLLGNSLGCQIVANLAVRYPALVAAAVLVGPTADPGGRTIPRLMARAAVDIVREDPRLYPIIVCDYLRAGVGRTWRTLEHLVRDRPEERFPRIVVPALVVRGERDAIVPQGWAEEVARLLPRGRLVVVPGAAHAVNFGAPGPLAQAVGELARDLAHGRVGPKSMS